MEGFLVVREGFKVLSRYPWARCRTHNCSYMALRWTGNSSILDLPLQWLRQLVLYHLHMIKKKKKSFHHATSKNKGMDCVQDSPNGLNKGLVTIAGAHTWANALASNPWNNSTCRQLCSQILIKLGLQHMCESRFRRNVGNNEAFLVRGNGES